MRILHHDVTWVPTGEVRIGDRIACLLSDAQAYPRVTGWSDRTLDLGDLGRPVQRTFRVTGAPWWADAGHLTGTLGEPTLIVERRGASEPTPDSGADSEDRGEQS